MKTILRTILILCAISSSKLQAALEYPIEKPYAEGYLQVSEKHQIFYAEYGNPEGLDVVILHGGPGAGCQDDNMRFFDLTQWHVVMFDQRGAMRSKPFAEMEENTTADSVGDMEKLRKHLGIEKWVIFGYSWGACLGLVYGETYPESCLGFILQGTFLGREEDIGFFRDMGKLSKPAYEEFLTHIPEANQNNIPEYCYKRLMDPDPTVHMEMAKAIMTYILQNSETPADPNTIKQMLTQEHYLLSIGRSFIHYAVHGCFLRPNQVLANLHKVIHLPGIIVHGEKDTVCLPEQALLLHQAWPGSQLSLLPEAGHSWAEPAIAEALVDAVHSLYESIPQVAK